MRWLVAVFLFLFVACATAPKYPRTEQIAHVHEIHGDKRPDPYAWLKDRKDPKVVAHLEEENKYAKSYLASTEKWQEKVFNEIVGRIKETDTEVPVKKGDYYYYQRTEQGKQYKIYARKKGSLEASEEVLIDLNQLAEGKEFLDLGVYSVSPDHRYLAYSIDNNGSEFYTIFVKDLQTGKLLKDQIPETYTSFAWANDNQTFFYTKVDKTHRPDRLYRHRLGEDASKDALVFHEKDLAYELSVTRTQDDKYLLITLWTFTNTEVHYLDATKPNGHFRIIQKRTPDLEYSVEHRDGLFYILNNHQATNFKISTAPVNAPGLRRWRDLISHDEKVFISGILMQKNQMVLSERRDGFLAVRYYRFADKTFSTIPFSEEVYSVSLGDNVEYNTGLVRLVYESPVTPEIIYDYDYAQAKLIVKKQKEVPGSFKASDYRGERIYVDARDGKKIPVTLLYKKSEMKKDGKNPCLVYGYGSYGSSVDPYFSPSIFSLVDRGFVYAIAHVRGGQELGRTWYDDGKMFNKQNTFNDFVDATEGLIKAGYINRDKIAMRGASAGGLLMGAVVNLRPDLYKAVLAHVPFVDVMTTMLDPDLRFSVLEYQQWGNPNEKKPYEYMRSYSPYDNIEKKAYPNIMATAGFNDSRVNYWEPAKWVAKLRDYNTSKNVILMDTKGTGHGGESGRYDRYKDEAKYYAFIWKSLGLEN